MIMLLVNRQFLLMLSLARIKETLTFPAIPSGPFLGDLGIVFGGQLQSKLCVAIGSFGRGDEFHLGTLKKNVHSFNRYFNHPLWSFSSTQKYPPLNVGYNIQN